MPPADVVLKEACERLGWQIQEMPAIPAEDGWIEIRGGVDGLVRLKAIVPRREILGYDPWDALLQAMYSVTRND